MRTAAALELLAAAGDPVEGIAQRHAVDNGAGGDQYDQRQPTGPRQCRRLELERAPAAASALGRPRRERRRANRNRRRLLANVAELASVLAGQNREDTAAAHEHWSALSGGVKHEHRFLVLW